MCDVCHYTPCDARCPNAPEPPVAYECLNCDSDIYEGDLYYDVDGDPWCYECIQNVLNTAESEEQ